MMCAIIELKAIAKVSIGAGSRPMVPLRRAVSRPLRSATATPNSTTTIITKGGNVA